MSGKAHTAPHAGSGASLVSRPLPHRLHWSETHLPQEWRNGRRAGLRSANSVSGKAHSLRLEAYCDGRRQASTSGRLLLPTELIEEPDP